jgi:hypothetical protein
MTTRTKANVVLISLLPVINEVWQYWEHNLSIVNPWFGLDYPIALQWYVKLLCQEVNSLVLAILLFRVSRLNSPLRLAATVYLLLCGFSLIMYLWNFNRTNYTIVYSSISSFTLVAAFYRQELDLYMKRCQQKIKRLIRKLRNRNIKVI